MEALIGAVLAVVIVLVVVRQWIKNAMAGITTDENSIVTKVLDQIAEPGIDETAAKSLIEATLKGKKFVTADELKTVVDTVTKKIPSVENFSTKKEVQDAISSAPLATTEEFAFLKSECETFRTMIDALSTSFAELRGALKELESRMLVPPPKPAPAPKVEEPTKPAPEPPKGHGGKKGSKKTEGAAE